MPALKKKIQLATLGIVAFATASLVAGAADEASVWDGIYTPAQSDRGQALYAKQCASCHRDSLQGHAQTPSLVGESFVGKWDGQTVGDLFEKMQTSMPADHPGSLSREENAAVLAFILGFNKFPAGATELPSESEALAKIRFKAAK